MVSAVSVACSATSDSCLTENLSDSAQSIFVVRCQYVVNSGLPSKRGEVVTPPCNDRIAATLVRVADQFTKIHRDYMVRSLKDMQLSVENIVSLYRCIAEAVVDDPATPMSWGRVVLLYALAKLMAQLCFTEQTPDVLTFVVYVGRFVEKKACLWIDDQGGWESIYKVFGERAERNAGYFLREIVQTVARFALKAFFYITPIPSVLLKS